MRFLQVEELRLLHDLAIDEYGGTPGLRDPLGLEAVCGCAEQAADYAEDLFDIAAAYILYINQRHPFVDGNKRTSLAVVVRFLSWNRVATGHSSTELGDLILGVATQTNRLSRERVAAVLREMYN